MSSDNEKATFAMTQTPIPLDMHGKQPAARVYGRVGTIAKRGWKMTTTQRMYDITATINALDKLCEKLGAHTVKDNVPNLRNVLQTHTEMLTAVAQINATIKNLRKHRKMLQTQLAKTESEFNRMFCTTMQQLDLDLAVYAKYAKKQADKT